MTTSNTFTSEQVTLYYKTNLSHTVLEANPSLPREASQQSSTLEAVQKENRLEVIVAPAQQVKCLV